MNEAAPRQFLLIGWLTKPFGVKCCSVKPILEEKIKEKELKKPRQFGMISLSTNK